MAGQPTRVENDAKTIVMNADTFQYETLIQTSGNATQIRFQLLDAKAIAGDVLVVLAGTEINFHGMISSVEDGFAIASDPRGSLLPAEAVQ